MKIRRALGVTLSALVAAAGALWLTARPVTESETRAILSAGGDEVARGAAAFMGGGFGGISMDSLQSNAVPWRLVSAALVLDEVSRDPTAPVSPATLAKVLARFGFFPDAQPASLPVGVKAAPSSLPFGMTYGMIAPVGGTKVAVANLGCAVCHAGVTYASDGSPQPSVVKLGMPNTSIDLEAYTLAVFNAFRRYVGDPALLETAATLFPDMDWRERLSLRLLVLPLAKQRLATLADVDRPLPFPNGTPGSTNGVAALKLALGTPLAGGGATDAGVVSIPDLSYRTWRNDLLADGIYAVPGTRDEATVGPPRPEHLRQLGEITTFFTVPSMGVHPDKARNSIDDAAAIMAFLADYRPQRFPGTIDRERAARGGAIYDQACASCHGTYSGNTGSVELISYPNWHGDTGTDPLRADMFDQPLVEAVGRSPYKDAIEIRPGRGYVAPPLGGLWASAPYLHNGSVPNLSTLLNPDERPRRFMVGGHALDLDRVGVRLADDGSYPAGYTPFSNPVWIDTATPGRSADGHRFGEDLAHDAKRDLIEYLKLL